MIKYIKSTELCELWWLELWFENLCCLDLRLLFSNLTFWPNYFWCYFALFWWLENLAHFPVFFMLATVFAFLIRNELTWFGCEQVILLHYPNRPKNTEIQQITSILRGLKFRNSSKTWKIRKITWFDHYSTKSTM